MYFPEIANTHQASTSDKLASKMIYTSILQKNKQTAIHNLKTKLNKNYNVEDIKVQLNR